MPAFVADTGVWIDFLAGRPTSAVMHLRDALRRVSRIGLTDVILTEVLQGLREDDVARVESRLAIFPVLRLADLDDFRRAAALHRAVRRKGLVVRRTSDCLIASVCIREDVPLLHDDRDFDHVAAVSELRVVAVPDLM